MKFTADFSTRNGYGNQICIADNIENLIIMLVNRGFNFVDGMQNEIVEWSKTTNKKYYRTGITIEDEYGNDLGAWNDKIERTSMVATFNEKFEILSIA